MRARTPPPTAPRAQLLLPPLFLVLLLWSCCPMSWNNGGGGGVSRIGIVAASAEPQQEGDHRVPEEEADGGGVGAEASTPLPFHMEPSVVHLKDDTFEHETQASTGQTTGSWLVWFFREDEEDAKHHFSGTFPNESDWLDQYVVVAAVNVLHAPQTAKRFLGDDSVNNKDNSNKEVGVAPSLIYISKGKYYSIASRDWAEIWAFCRDPPLDLGRAIPKPQALSSSSASILSWLSDLLFRLWHSNRDKITLLASAVLVLVGAVGIPFLVLRSGFKQTEDNKEEKPKAE
jgi:hypothetical protein